jgi:hypothetical protein
MGMLDETKTRLTGKCDVNNLSNFVHVHLHGEVEAGQEEGYQEEEVNGIRRLRLLNLQPVMARLARATTSRG